MASEDEAMLADLVDATTKATGVTSPMDANVCDALVAMKLGKFKLLSYWGDCCLLKQPPQPEDLSRFRQRLVASSNGTLTNDDDLKLFVAELVNRLGDEYRKVKAVSASAPSAGAPAAADGAGAFPGVHGTPSARALTEDEIELKESTMCYDKLAELQNKYVDLDMRATCVAKMHQSVKAYGYISDCPSVANVPRYGRAGAGKRKVRLADADASLEIGTKTGEKITDLQAAHQAARVLCYAICAALTVRIVAHSYGGRDVGWVVAPGHARQVRLLITLEVLERFLWALMGIATVDPYVFTTTTDLVFQEFCNTLARRELHPDEIMNNIIATKTHLYIPRAASESGTQSQHSGSTGSARANQAGGNGDDGVCLSWLTNGGCRNESCHLAHPDKMRGSSFRSGRGASSRPPARNNWNELRDVWQGGWADRGGGSWQTNGWHGGKGGKGDSWSNASWSGGGKGGGKGDWKPAHNRNKNNKKGGK